MASESTTFSLKIKPSSRMIRPIGVLDFMFTNELSKPAWSALEIRRRLFQIKIGHGDKIYALFNLIPCVQPGGILREITHFNAVDSVDFELSLGRFNHILDETQNDSEYMVMSHVNHNDSISICYEDDPTRVNPLPAWKQIESFSNFSTHALTSLFCFTIHSSLLRDSLLSFLNDHSQSEDPVMIEVTREKVVFFVGEAKMPESSISYTIQVQECDIKIIASIRRYEATVTWNNRISLAEASRRNHQKARLHGYQHPLTGDRFITWSFLFEPDVYETIPSSTSSMQGDQPVPDTISSMQGAQTVPDTDNIGSTSAPSQMPDTGDIDSSTSPWHMQDESSELDSGAASLASSELQEILNAQAVIDDEDNLTQGDNDDSYYDLPLQPFAMAQNLGRSSFRQPGLVNESSTASDVGSDGSSSSPIMHKAVFDHDVEASTSKSIPSQVKDVGAIGGLMFVYYPKDVTLTNAE